MSNLLSEIFGWFGAVLAIVFYIAPVYQFNELIKGKIDYKKIPFVLLLMSFLTILFWLIFGFLKPSYQIIITNIIGGIATGIFIIIYFIYFTQKNMSKSSIYIISFILISILISIITYKFIEMKIIGNIAMVFNIIMFASPCLKIIQVCQTKDYKFLPIGSSIAGMASSTSWFIYGIGTNEFSLILPNGLGLCFSIVQIIVFIMYYNKSKSDVNKIGLIEEYSENKFPETL